MAYAEAGWGVLKCRDCGVVYVDDPRPAFAHQCRGRQGTTSKQAMSYTVKG